MGRGGRSWSGLWVLQVGGGRCRGCGEESIGQGGCGGGPWRGRPGPGGVGAGGEGGEVSAIAVQLVREGQIRQARAEELVRALGDERPSAHIGSDSR